MGQWELNPKEQAAALEFLRALVRTPSLPGKEGAAAELIMQEMRRLNFTEVRMDAAGNVIGGMGAAAGPTLMLSCHMDTVEAGNLQAWKFDPWSAEVRDGRLYGLGACDMKSGVAAALYGVALAARHGILSGGQMLVTCVGLEEPSEGTGTRTLLTEDGLTPQWVVVAEPSDLHVVRAQRGHMEMRLTVKGRSAHSSTPGLGDNAIYAASRLIFGLEILAEQLAEDPFLGAGVLAITDIRSYAASRNAIPDRCELILDRRLTVGETESLALREVQRIITREGVGAEVSVIEEDVTTHTGRVYRARRYSPPWMLDERHPLVMAMQLAARDAGLRPTLTCWPFATEGAYSAGVAQIPTIGFGPGNPHVLHTPNEYVEYTQVYSAAAAYAALAARLFNTRK